MGNVFPGVPQPLALMLSQAFGIRSFVETGTYLGETAQWASGVFDHVYTIEAAEDLYQRARARFADVPHIEVLFGDSGSVISHLIPRVTSRTLFWLDAHWSGGETYGAETECPVVREIESINQSSDEHFILIDDAQYFLAPPPFPHAAAQWPALADLVDLLRPAHHARYIVVMDDVIIAVPVSARAMLVQYAQERATQRLQQAQSRQRSIVDQVLRRLTVWREN